MLFNLSFVFEITETQNIPKIVNSKYAIAKNREELINIIRSLKYYQNELNNINESDTELNDEEKETKLQNILWLLKKNYDARKHFDYLHNNRFHSASRRNFIKNPLVLEEYKNHLNKIRRFSKKYSTKHNDQQNNLKNKLRNLRRDAMFRIGSSESNGLDFDKKEEKEERKVRNDIQAEPYVPIKIKKTKESKVLKKDMFSDTLELHNSKVHNSARSDNDFRQEKSKWHKRHENSNNVDGGSKIKNTYRNQPSLKKNRFEVETLKWDKITTRNDPINYKKKKTLKESEFKIKPSYRRPKNDKMNKDFHSYGRTSIPFVGKRGIYDEK